MWILGSAGELSEAACTNPDDGRCEYEPGAQRCAFFSCIFLFFNPRVYIGVGFKELW